MSKSSQMPPLSSSDPIDGSQQQSFDLIIGIHSIVEALKNRERKNHFLIATEKGLSLLKEKERLSIKNSRGTDSWSKDISIKIVSNEAFNELSQKSFKELGYTYSKISSQLLLKTSPLNINGVSWLLDKLNSLKASASDHEQSKQEIKILALDRVTDVHNGAAILRTAAFYGVNALIMSIKGNFNLTPAFYRIASGATEHVPIVKCHNLSRIIQQMQEKGVECIGLTEHASGDIIDKNSGHLGRCLVLGSEDEGLSNAVERVIKKKIRLESKGKILTLNVSIAAAVAMERCFF